MAHSKQAKKRIRQNEKRRLRNKTAASTMKTRCKKVLEAAAAGDGKQAEEHLSAALSSIDKAAKTHVIHANTAARKKSQIMRAVQALETKGTKKKK